MSDQSNRFSRITDHISVLIISVSMVLLVMLAKPKPEKVANMITQPTLPPTPSTVTVHILGAVRKPGVYTLPARSRVVDVVKMAGGFTTRADTMSVNLAQILRDEMQVIVPFKAPSSKLGSNNGQSALNPTHSSGSAAQEPQVAPININTATKEQLEELPGIGPSKAAAIIEFRQKHGPFNSLEDLLDVPGIGPSTLENIKSMVVFR